MAAAAARDDAIALVRRVRRRLARAGLIANVGGGLVVFIAVGFLIPVFNHPEDSTRLGLFNAPLVVLALTAGSYVTFRYLDGHLVRTLGWLVEGRAPGEREHRASLRLALFGVKLTAVAWLLAVPVFACINGFTQGWDLAIVVAATMWLGGETTCALSYLASERALRPVTALVLAARPTSGEVGPGMRGRLVGAWALGTGVPLLGVLVVAIVGLVKGDAGLGYVSAAVLFLGLVATATGLLATVYTARAIAEPLTAVKRGVERIESGDLDVHLAVDDGSELGLLQAGFNRMADGLRERERIRDLFGRQVGRDVARTALAEHTRLGGEERLVGALFVDIVGSTAMAMTMPATEVVRLLNRFFRVVVEVVEADGALVNKFEGDAALCVFGAPVPRDDPAGDALRSARRLAERLTAELPELDFGIGISAGMAVAGNVGAEQRFEYTVIGDPVNEASRLSDLAKQRPERVLASGDALRLGGTESDAWRLTDSAVLRGRNAATALAHPRV